MAAKESISITGKTIITDKINFEPDGLEKPDVDNYVNDFLDNLNDFHIAMRKYEASKQLFEVENEIKNKSDYKMFENMDYLIQINDVYYFKQHHKIEGSNYLIIKNNQPCTAEIIGEMATIIELTKE